MKKLFSVLFFLINVWILTRGDGEVSCKARQSCILPCSFTPGDNPVIHWYHLTPTRTVVHSYYNNTDQREHQDQRFRGRTSLFQDQFSKGNASLLLTEVMDQDEGSYQCFTRTTRNRGEISINMKVYGIFHVIIIIIIVVVVLVITAVLLLVIYRKRIKKHENHHHVDVCQVDKYRKREFQTTETWNNQTHQNSI